VHLPLSLSWAFIGSGVLLAAVLFLGIPTLIRFVLRLALGALVLLALDVFGRPLHFFLGLNPASLAVVGILGVPGLLLLGGLHMLLFP